MKKLYVLSALLLVLIVLASGCENPKTNVKTEKTLTINDVTVHYSGDVSISQAKGVINFVHDYFDVTGKTDVYLEEAGNHYKVGIVTPYKSPEDMSGQTKFAIVLAASRLSQDVLSDEPVTLQYLSSDKDVLLSAESKYRYLENSKIYVWYSGVNQGEAQKVLDYLVDFAGQGPWDVILEKSGSTYHVKAMSSFTTVDEANSARDAYMKLVSGLENVLGGNVVLHVLDPNGNELTTFGP
jgi:phosphoribosyl-AMP cyclohydrolase